ncbi:hypothetical protein ACHAWF_013456 [Thalassiosira exigua]
MAPPLNIAISLGDVSFHLTPSTRDNHPPKRSPSPPQQWQARKASPYAPRRTRIQQRRRNGSERAVTASFSQQQQNNQVPGSPLVTIRHGSPQSMATPSANNLSLRSPSSPQSPLEQHIKGRVRAMKNKIESQDDSRRNAGYAGQSPSFPPSDEGEGEYCVDLHSFTGTLHITSSKSPGPHTPLERGVESEALLSPSPRPKLFSPRSNISTGDDSLTDSIRLMKKRTKNSTWISTNANEVETGIGADANEYDDEEGVDFVVRGHSQNMADSKKAVRFSTAHQDSIIASLSEEETKDQMSNQNAKLAPESLGNKENASPNQTALLSRDPTSSPQQLTMQHQNQASKRFFSSPPTTFPSPQRAAATTARASLNIARGTSTVLARSGKHALKQIALAGKEVYDVINGHSGASPGNSASKNKKGGTTCNIGAEDSIDVGDHDEEYNAFDGTELHYACASDNLAHVRCLLEYENLVDLFESDCDGKLPIHVFAENKRLIGDDPLGCEDVAFLLVESMGPEKAVQALHPCGFAPFIHLIWTWTERLHQGALSKTSSFYMRNPLVKKPTCVKTDDEESQQDNVDKAESGRRRVAYRSLFHQSTVGTDKISFVSTTDRNKLLYLPATVSISDQVRWAIRILSRLIDEYPEQTREAILTNMATVPLFLKSLLLIDDENEMMELLDMSLVKHTILDKRSINVWLCAMLMDSKKVKNRAVIFIKILSRLTIQDLSKDSTMPDRYSDKEIQRYSTLRDKTFNAVHAMSGIVPAVLELGGSTIEQISTTSVMRYITDRTIRKEKVFFFLICDFFYAMFLLMGFRLIVEFVLFYQSMNGPEGYRDNGYVFVSTMGIAGYFLVKEAMTLLSLSMTSKKLAKRYCSSVFNIIDLTAVAMLLGSQITLTSDLSFMDNEGFLASLTMILLWLKLMGAFKVLNGAFSLFLYAVFEVIKDVKWFLVFLFAVTLMFADATRTIVAVIGDCQPNIDGERHEILEEYCSDDLFSVITRMYAVLVGDVALEYFQTSDAMVTLFFFFSFFTIIILLNILVAIIINSYEGSKQRSIEIFSRGRVEYAAHLVARKQFLTPRKHYGDFHVATYVPQNARRALRLVYILVSAVALLSFEFGFIGTIHFLLLPNKDDYRMIHSMIIVYVCVGSIFNAYILSAVVIALFSSYDKRKRRDWLSTNHNTILHNMMANVIVVLEAGVKLFHRVIFDEDDKSVAPRVAD